MTKAEEIVKGSTLLATIKSEFSKGNSEDLEKDLLRMVNQALSQRELLKKFWKYFDEECVAVNCNEEERDEVITNFFNSL